MQMIEQQYYKCSAPALRLKSLEAQVTDQTDAQEKGVPPSQLLLSDYPHPYPTLRHLQKEIVRYKRLDDVDLTATLYLPPGYDAARDGRLPCLMWAYPREFKTRVNPA